MAWSIRIRGPGGQHTLTGLSPDMSVANFQQQVAGPTGIAPERQEFRSGFPPAQLAIPPDATATTIVDWGLKQGDTVVISAAPVQMKALGDADLAQMSEDEMMARAIAASLGEAPPTAPTNQKPSYSPPAPAAASSGSRSVTNAPDSSSMISRQLPSGRHIIRRVVDSDNSCLFNAVGYNLERSRKVAPKLRRVVAMAVKADPVTFNEGFLGKDNDDYQRWIQDPQKWGGGIELYILSRHFQVEIAAYDIQTQRVDIYGQECGYKQRCMLVYDGLHYDALAVCASPGAPESADCTLLDVDSPDLEEVMAGAAFVVARMNAMRKFTDTANFTLRCGVCLVGLKGEKEAVEHAKATGHQNFQEY